jgi:hypothetical protein
MLPRRHLRSLVSAVRRRASPCCASVHTSRPAPLIYVIAGEASGDAIGARLMGALLDTGPVEFRGVGGYVMPTERTAGSDAQHNVLRSTVVHTGRACSVSG